MNLTRGQNGTTYDVSSIFSIDMHLRTLTHELKKRLENTDLEAVKWAQNEIDLLLDARLKVMPNAFEARHRRITQ